MPLYEYLCKKCGYRFERIQKFSDPLVKKCPECSGVVEQVLSAPAVQFKGSGWYVTDYAKKSASSAKSPEKDGAATEPAKSDSGEGKTESKSESKTDSKKEGKKSPAKK